MGTHRPFGAEGECTSFTANRNCIAHTRRQHKLRDSVNAHRANVTSYTTANSSGALVAGADIFSRNSKAKRANSRLTRHKSARDVNASSVAALKLLDLPGLVLVWAPFAFPLAIFGGDATGIGATTETGALAVCCPGLTLAEVPPTECLEESNVETLRGK